MVDHVGGNRDDRAGHGDDRVRIAAMGTPVDPGRFGGESVRVSRFRVGEIRKQITDGPIWLNYGQAVTDYAIGVLERALMDAEAELTEAQCAVTIAQRHVAGVHALIEEASGWGATKRTNEALLAQLRRGVSGRGQAPPAEHGGTYCRYHDFQEDQGIAPDVCVWCGAAKDAPLHMPPGKVLGRE
jgi:hypothetical protein